LGAQGTVDEAWLDTLLQHPYYGRRPPKTTGRELFSSVMGQELVAAGQARGLSDADILASLTALTARSIADAYRRFAPAPISEVLLAGGGSRNPTLVRMLQSLLAPAPVLTHEAIGLDSDFKEALIFALLAHETWFNRPGNLPSLTGASHPVIMGQITPGRNFPPLER
jgi:anhydro-N-acetylmuramic acid kinase